MTTTTMIQAVTTMVPTRQMRMLKTMRGKRTTTNLHEIWTPALKTWMSRLNHYPVRWKVWRRTRKRKRPNDSTLPRSTSPPSEVHKAGGSNIGEVSSCLPGGIGGARFVSLAPPHRTDGNYRISM